MIFGMKCIQQKKTENFYKKRKKTKMNYKT